MTKFDVTVVDIGISNIASVTNALVELGFYPEVADDPGRLGECDRLILPGNGSFRIGSERLFRSFWAEAICEFAETKKPILGICLGMHLLATSGEEDGYSVGLDLIPGVTRRIEADGLRIPHVGWNTVTQLRDHFLFQGIKQDRDFYFSHSFFFDIKNGSDTLCETSYGQTFSSVIQLENIAGVQFHPEKSQKNGLRVLDQFMKWNF